MATPSRPLVLPEGLVIAPVAELPPSVRSRFQSEEDAYAVSKPRSRVPTRIVDPGTARLLEEFRSPATVVEAVLNYSRAAGRDPEQVLTEVHPILLQLAADQLLVSAGSDLSRPVEASLRPGESFAGTTIVENVSVLDDSELHRGRTEDGTPVALKVARAGHALAASFEHEARILERLPESTGPRLLERGEHEGRPFLVLEWIEGVPAPQAVRDPGDPADPAARRERLALAVRVLDRYAELHRARVLHGDVHPGNILVTGDDTVRLVDFGLARTRDAGELAPVARGGVMFYLEPEVVAQWGKGSLPPSTEAGEQYALGAVLYLLMTGASYLDFRLEQSEIRRQVVEEPPRAFRDAGVSAWPEVEAVLARALAKRPQERHPSVESFRDRLQEILARIPVPVPGASAGSHTVTPAARAFLESYLVRVRSGGEAYVQGYDSPHASIMFGAAGLGYALYRAACVGEDAGLLALSDHWATRALGDLEDPAAFYNRDMELTPELLGPNALFHTASGIRVTAALVALAHGNTGLHASQAAGFLKAAEVPTANLDLTMGRAGALLGALFLQEAHPEQALKERAGRWARSLWDEVNAAPPIPEATIGLNLGLAHGWAGVLYVLLRWQLSTGEEAPDGFRERLRELAACAEPAGRGLRWPWREPGRLESVGSMPGWCNGSAGFVLLWTLAAEVLGDSEWTDLAERAAWNAWQGSGTPGSLCCGAVGVAYSLLNLARHTGDSAWIDRAAGIANRTAMHGVPGKPRDSLYKGDLGLALLIGELAHPERARMPFVESEGWPEP